VPSLSDLYLKNIDPQSYLGKPEPKKSTALIKHPKEESYNPTLVDVYPKNENPKAFVSKPENKSNSQFLKAHIIADNDNPSLNLSNLNSKEPSNRGKNDSPSLNLNLNSKQPSNRGKNDSLASPEQKSPEKSINISKSSPEEDKDKSKSPGSSAEKKKPVYHTKPNLKLEKPTKDHFTKALVSNSSFPHYVHPDVAKNKKYKSPTKNKT